jgi:hypothetical protein
MLRAFAIPIFPLLLLASVTLTGSPRTDSSWTNTAEPRCQSLLTLGSGFQPLAKTCQFARESPHTLPEFVCTETAKRYFSPKHKPDIITAELTVGKSMQSHYASVLVNGKIPRWSEDRSADDLFEEQVTSWGEFALLFDVFDPLSKATFASPEDVKIGHEHVKRYDFLVKRENNLHWGLFFMNAEIYPGYHGSVFVNEAGKVVRVESNVGSEEVDSNTIVSSVKVSLDYLETPIGDTGIYNLPHRAETTDCFRSLLGCVHQEITFTNFHKFGSESRILFH